MGENSGLLQRLLGVRAMAHKKMITIIAAVLVLVTVSGCLESGRKESAQLRWQRTMDQAKLEAAQQSLEQGQLAYAEKILDECENSSPESPLASEVQQIRERVQHESNQYAKAGSEIKSIEEMIY